MASRHSKLKKDDACKLADEVLVLLKRSERDGFDETAFSEDARRVAAAMARLENLASGFFFTDPTPDFRFRRADGGLEALLLLDALMNGNSHPIWRFLDGMRGTGRKTDRQVSAKDSYTQAIVAGCAKAVQSKSEHKSEHKVAAFIAAHPAFKSVIPLEGSTVRNWMRRIGTHIRSEYAAKVAEKWASELQQECKSTDEMMCLTAHVLRQHLDSPKVREARFKVPVHADYHAGGEVMRVTAIPATPPKEPGSIEAIG
jgi:hypothetical protein